MAAMQSPFIRKTVKCPACHHPHSQRYFRKNVFVTVSEEPDKHVAEYRWVSDKVTPVHPPFYFTAYCPACYYTDTIEDFSDPWRTAFGPYVIKYFRRLTGSGDVVTDTLGSRVNYEDIDLPSALNLHYLALYAQLLPPDDLKDAYKIARILLRIAWLYRENPPGTGQAQPASGAARPRSSSKRAVLGALDTLEKRIEGLEKPHAAALKAVDDFVAGQGETDDTDNPFAKSRAQLEQMLEAFRGTVVNLRDAVDTYKPAPAAPPPKAAEREATAAPMEPAEHRSLMEELRTHWPEMPLTEEEATADAIEWFTWAIEKDSRLSSHENYSAIGALVAQLHIRMKQFEAALDMVTSVYQSAVETRMKYMEKLREDKSLGETDRKKLEARMNRVASGIEELVDFRDEIVNNLFERDKEAIARILNATKGKTAKAREEALTAKGIRNEVITRLKRKGGPLAADK